MDNVVRESTLESAVVEALLERGYTAAKPRRMKWSSVSWETRTCHGRCSTACSTGISLRRRHGELDAPSGAGYSPGMSAEGCEMNSQ